MRSFGSLFATLALVVPSFTFGVAPAHAACDWFGPNCYMDRSEDGVVPSGSTAPMRMKDAIGQTAQGIKNKLLPLPYTFMGQVATNTGYPPNALLAAGTATQASFRQPHYVVNAGKPLTELTAVLPCFWVGIGALDTENSVGSPSTWKYYIEYPAGTFQTVTFGGNSTGTCIDGKNFYTDKTTLTAPIPDGARFWTDGFVTNPGGIVYKSNPDPSGNNGQFFNTGTGALADPSVTPPTGSNGHGMLSELALLAPTNQRSFIIIDSDSRAAGQADSADVTGQPRADVGNVARSLAHFAPYINLAVSGSYATGFVNGTNAQRLELVKYATDAIITNTMNDVFNNVPATTIQAALVAARALLPPAMPVTLATSEPATSSNNVAVSALTANGNGLLVTSTGSGRLYVGEFVTISGATPSTDNGPCLVTLQPGNGTFACLNPNATGTATATGTITYNDNYQAPNNQTTNTNNPVRVAMNNWKRTLPLSLAGFSHVIDLADIAESGRDSGKWGSVSLVPYEIGTSFQPTLDGTHETPAMYWKIENSGIINPFTISAQ